MEIVKLKPAVKDYIWGGKKLKEWGKSSSSDIIAECWELSFNLDGPSLIDSGKDKGKFLKDIATPSDIGSVPASFQFFPILNKLIDAADNLSVQVHPSDDYALANEGQYGKTEMWYVIHAEPGSGLYVGFQNETTPEEVRDAVDKGTLLSLLSFHEVKEGETYFIPSGTVHAIGRGVMVMEIQQNSTLTYRLYDYKRLGKDGKPRELHLEKALKVLDYHPYNPPHFKKPCLGACSYFQVYEVPFDGEKNIVAPKDSFVSLTFVEGEGSFASLPFKKGDTFFVPCGKSGVIKGKGKAILSQVEHL